MSSSEQASFRLVATVPQGIAHREILESQYCMQLSVFSLISHFKCLSYCLDEHRQTHHHCLNTNLIFDSAYFNLVQSDPYCPSIFILLSEIYLWWFYYCLIEKLILGQNHLENKKLKEDRLSQKHMCILAITITLAHGQPHSNFML